MKKTFLALVIVFTLSLPCLTGCGAASPSGAAPGPEAGGPGKTLVQVHMAFSSEHPSYARMEAFAKRANELSNNAFTFKIYPNSTLGDYTVVTEELIRGNVEMLVDSLNTGVDSRFDLTYTPYLCAGLEDCDGTFGPGGFVYEQDKKMLAENGIVLLGFDMVGMGGLELGDKCPAEPFALGKSEGLQVRSAGNEHLRVLLEQMGYNPVTLNYSEIYTAMQTGVVEGFIGADAQTALDQFGDVISYHLCYDMCANTQYVAFSAKVWDTLTGAQRKALETAAAENFAQSIQDSIAADATIYDKMEAAGITVLRPTEEELNAIIEMTRTVAWPAAESRLGTELYHALLDEYGIPY